MKRLLTSLLFLFLILGLSNSQGTGWKIAGDRITTAWAAKVDPLNPLPEYPRPQMVRSDWKNLNGLWEYAVTGETESRPGSFEGKILVPFAIESALSGVGRELGQDKVLWYRTVFTVPRSFKNKRILLHFGAVDWSCEVYINGSKAAVHQGGYDAFTCDITGKIKDQGPQLLEVKVTDPADHGPQPRGKQVSHPGGIWYTSVSGIWQTVWLEPVPETYISSFKNTPDIDNRLVNVEVNVQNRLPGDIIRVTALREGVMISETETAAGDNLPLPVPEPRLWSPDDPFLYDLDISIIRGGKVIDGIKGYFAMRKISLKPDAAGIQRMMLNNRFIFEFGPLDQGWWPDGLYTAPTDEALMSDIVRTREMGFNLIRKHVKVEPARWYYYCDKEGIMVWQDMPSGDLGGGRWNTRPGMEGGFDKTRTDASENIYRAEWNAIIDCLYNFPCIITWVPFNESWGQFKSVEITEWTRKKDPSRLVNSASGGNFHDTGDILDLHNYPGPVMAKPEVFGSKQALVLGEYGGLGLPLEGHTWLDKDNWGYRTFADADTLFRTYSSYIDEIVPFILRGLSAAVYTQTTDVEVETNGLITYDREVMKNPASELKEAAGRLYRVSSRVVF